MSVDVKVYCLVGVLLLKGEYESLEYDSLEPYMDDKGQDGLRVIYDGMCGKYVAIGKVIAEGNDDDGHLEEPATFVAPENMDREVKELASKIAAILPDAAEFRIGYHIISHYH